MFIKNTYSFFSMIRTKFLIAVLLLVFGISPVFAQLSGTKTIPGDYASITAAVTDLNTQGVGSGGVTFNVAAGFTESIIAPIIITATGTSGNPIIFQKSGAGANPLVTRTDAGTITTSAMGGDGDAVIQLNGTDYITFNGIDLAASDQGIDYGYYTFKPSGTDGCQFVTIQNCVVTLTRGTNQYSVGIYISNGPASGSSATGVTVTAASGMNANVTVIGNTIQNVASGIYVRGSTAYYDSVITIGQSGAGNIIQNFGINTGSANTEYGVYFIYVENPAVAYNTIDNAGGGGTAHNGTFYCVFYSTVSGDVVGSNNTMTIANAAATSSTYYFYNTNTCNSETFTDNTFASTGTLPSGSLYFIYLSNATPTKTISNNTTIGTITKAGGGTYCYYNAGGASAGGTEVITNNNFSNIVISSGSSTFYGIYSNTYAAHSKVMSNNTLSNINSSSTGTFYCFYALASIPNQVNNNTAFNITHGGSMYGVYLTGTGAAYNNNIYGLTSTTVSTNFIDGIYVSSGTFEIYNNFVSDLNAPSSTSTTAGVSGIYLSGGTQVNLYYNTVYLKYTSVVAGNISTALYVGSTTPTTVDMRDNIFVNDVDVTTGTYALAFRKGSTSLTNLASTVNNNLYYAGTPSAKNLIFYDGTNSDQTLAAYKSRVAPLESASITENPPFINSTTTPYNLHINTGVATQIESGGTPVAVVTVDYDGDTRNATTPDIGADEFNGIAADLTPPTIVYTALGYTSSTSARTLTAAISDASGVPTSGVGLPVLYWRINSGTWSAATATYISGTDYQFIFGNGVVINDTVKYYICAQDNATPTNVGAFPSGGAGGFSSNPPAASIPPTNPSSYLITNVSLAGDYTVGLSMFNMITGKNISFEKVVKKVMKEVVVLVPLSDMQEQKGKENEIISTKSSAQSATKQLMEVEETTWIPMENGKPYIGDLYVKKVDHPELNFPDGIDGIYSTITAAVTDLNLRGVAGPVRFLLTDASYSTGETYPITINIINENVPTVTNTVTFKPNTGVTSVITGATAQNIFGIYDDYIIFDGSNTIGGTTRDLSIVNTFTGGSFNLVVVLWNSGTKVATNVTIENCIIEGTPTTSSSYGLFLNAAGGGFHNTSFINNKIQNVKIGVQFVGVLGNVTNDGLISGNIIGDDTKPVLLAGILGSYVDNLIIEGNEIFGQAAGNTNTGQYGILLSTGSTNSKIRKNSIHDFYYTGTSGYGCFGIRYNSDATTFTEISNNLIYNIKGDGDASSLNYDPAGIYIISGGNLGIYYNSIYMSGNTLGQGTSYNGRSTCVSIATGITMLDIRDNIFQNSMDQFPGSTRTNTTYGIYSSSANTAFTFINYNDYFVNGINPFVGYLGADQLNLAAWQTATGQDLNSISADPLYQSTTDLKPALNSPVLGAGTPIAGITSDYLGVTRNATNPSMGAYEEGTITHIPAGTYTVGLSEFIKITGKRIYFEKRTRTVTKDLLADNSFLDVLAPQDEKNETAGNKTIDNNQRHVTVTEEYLEMMENGKPFDKNFFKNNSTLGVYPTITSAIADLVLRGIAGPVTFLLVDTNYPTETYPLVIPDIVGASEINTITFKPGSGVQANIPGDIAQTTSTFQLGGSDWVIIDGSNTTGGTTKDLHITCPLAYPAFHFYGGSNHNLVMNTIFDSKNTSSGSGTFLFGSGASGDSNYVENCLITKSDTSAVLHGVGVYFFSNNTSNFNKIVSCEVSDFNYYGFRPQGAPSTNNLIKGNYIHQTVPSNTSVYGIYISRQPGLIVEDNYISDLQSTSASPSLIGIYYLGSSGNPVDIYIRNNVVSISATVNQPAGTIRGIDYFAYAANSAEIYFNTIYIGGTNVTGGTSTGLSKRDAATLLKIYDNAVYNTRSNGIGTGKHYGVYFSNITAPFEMNNNDYFVDGNGGVFGYYSTADVTGLAEWQTLTSQDANSISSNPIFVSNIDYRPQTVSPLLDAGVTIAGITTDILGDLRGTPPTIGAYENGVFVQIASPTYLVAIADTFTVDLAWQDNSNNEFGFVIERKDGDSLSVNPFLPLDTVGTNVINYLDTGLLANTTYTYRIYGYNGAGNSGYSNLAQATTFIPVELTSFTAEVTGRDITIKWSTATETNNYGFDIERKLDGDWEKIGFKDGKGSTTEKSEYAFTDKFTYTSYKGKIIYRLKQTDFSGTYAYSNEVEIDADFTPKEYTLYQNYPNPFNPITTIKYSLPFDSKVRIAIYNILGELVNVAVDEVKEIGYHDYRWNAANLASGIYIYTIEAKSIAGDKNYSAVKKMILMK